MVRALPRNSTEERSLLAEYGGFGSSLFFRSRRITGDGQGTFVFAVPLDADFSVDTALSMAGKLQSRESPVNILIAFLGNEKNELPVDLKSSYAPDKVSHRGLRDLLTLTDMPENWVLCYMDADAQPDELILRHGRRGYVAPLSLIEPLPPLFLSRNIPFSFAVGNNSIYKLGLIEGPEALRIAWEEEVNGFLLSDRQGKIGRKHEEISPDSLAELLLEYSSSLDFPILNPDRHYSFIPFFGGKYFFATEGATVILILLVTGFFLSIYLLYSARYNAILVYHSRLFLKSFWIFLLFLPVLVICIKISGSLYFLLFRALNAPSGTANYTGVGLTFLTGILLFYLPSPVLDLVHFPQRARFYGFSALIFGIFGILSAAFMDFSYIPFFLLAFIFVFIAVIVSNPALVFLSSFSVLIFALAALLSIFETNRAGLSELFIFSSLATPENWTASIQVSLITLTILMLLKRGFILLRKSFRENKKPNRKSRLVFLPVIIIASIAAMVIQILILKQINRFDARIVTEISETDGKTLSLSVNDIVFQDSRIITLNLGARGNPIRFDVSLDSFDERSLLPLYSSPVPYERVNDGKTIHFSLGEHPHNPLTIEIVLPLEFEGRLKAEAIYNTWDPEIAPGEKPESDNYYLLVTGNIGLDATTARRY